MMPLLVLVVVVVAALYGAHRLDEWETRRELDWRYEDTMRRAREALDRVEDEFPSVSVFDREAS